MPDLGPGRNADHKRLLRGGPLAAGDGKLCRESYSDSKIPCRPPATAGRKDIGLSPISRIAVSRQSAGSQQNVSEHISIHFQYPRNTAVKAGTFSARSSAYIDFLFVFCNVSSLVLLN